jgi:hypothetical protein
MWRSASTHTIPVSVCSWGVLGGGAASAEMRAQKPTLKLSRIKSTAAWAAGLQHKTCFVQSCAAFPALLLLFAAVCRCDVLRASTWAAAAAWMMTDDDAAAARLWLFGTARQR